MNWFQRLFGINEGKVITFPDGNRSESLLDEVMSWTEYICPKCDTIIYDTGLGSKERVEKHKKTHEKT